jgi:hypothetical protein
MLACLLANKIIQTTKDIGSYFHVILKVYKHLRGHNVAFIGVKLRKIQISAKKIRKNNCFFC